MVRSNLSPSSAGFRRLGEVRVDVDVLERLVEVQLVLAAVEDDHLVASLQQAVD